MTDPWSPASPLPEEHQPRRHLTPQQIQMIEEALCSLGDYGELRLIIEKGRLRFITTQKSFDTQKWKPGSLVKDSR